MPQPLQIKSDSQLMAALIRLAGRQLGHTFPNPVVAAAVIKEGKVISQAAHLKAGGPHAEVRAIQPVFEQCAGATLLVTLEPCTHFGRTPPCTDIILRAGIKKVIYAVDDPNPKVRERSAKSILKAAGVAVVSGLCEGEARELNRVYFKNRLTHRPFVTLKAAVSLDGRIALENGQSKYITSPASLARVHALRAMHDAILVGVGTIAADDPSLTIRLGTKKPKSNTVIVLDPHLRTPKTAKIFQDRTPSQVIIVTAQSPDRDWQSRATFIRLAKAPFNLDDVLARCYQQGICAIFVEGGGHTHSEFIRQKVADRAHFFIAPVLMMGKCSIPVVAIEDSFQKLSELPRLTQVMVNQWGEDVEVSGTLMLQ